MATTKLIISDTDTMAKQTTDRRINLYINGKEVRNNIKSIAGEYKKSKSQLAKLTRGTEEYNRKAAEVRKLKGILDQHNNQLRQTRTNWQKLGDKFREFLPMLGLGTAVLGARRLVKFQQQLEKTRQEASKLTGLTGEALDTTTAKVQSVVDTYNQDFQEVLKASNSLAKTMKISHEEALDTIQKGFVAGADSSGEYLDMLKEYPALLAEVGLNAEETTAIITQQVQQGVFSDKGIDAIKEANIRLREMPGATKEALDAIGLSSEQIQRQLEKGEKSMFDIIQMVSQKLSELPPQSQKVGQAIADIFAGPGEDAGLEYIKTLKDVNTSMDDIMENTTKYQKQQQRLMDSNENLNKSFNDVFGSADGLIANLRVTFNNMLASFISGFKTIEQIRRETMETGLREVMERDKKEVDEYGETAIKSFENMVEAQEQRVKTGVKNIKQIQMEKNLFGEASTAAVQYNEKERQAAEERLEMYKKRLAEMKRYFRIEQIQIQEIVSGSGDGGGGSDINTKAAEGLEKLKSSSMDLTKIFKDNTRQLIDSVSELEDAEGIQKIIDQTNELEEAFNFIPTYLGEQDIFGMTDEDWQKVQNNFQKVQAGAWEIGMTLSNVAQIQKNQNEKELREYREVQEQKKQSLERRLDAGIISEKEYNQRVEQVDEQLAEKQAQMAKEEAKRQKQINTFQAVIDTAAAIIGYLANPGGIPGLILSGMAAATGATQIAAIQSQPVPQFAEGGRVRKNQVIEVAEGDKEEGILSNRTLTDPDTGPMANYLLDKQDGMTPAVPDAGAISQAMDYNNFKRAGGGYSKQEVTNNYYTKSRSDIDNSQFAKDVRELKKYMSDPDNRRAYISDDIQKEHDEDQQLLDSLNKM